MEDRFELPGELSIYTVAEVREALLNWLRTPEVQGAASLSIAADKVAEVDGAGVQLLGSLAQSLAHKGVDWRVAEPSQALREACSAMGALGWLERAEGAGGQP